MAARQVERQTTARDSARDAVSVTVVDVDKVYESGSGDRITALEGINLDVKPGEFLAVVGPSGCGKSTLLSMVSGLDAPTAGRIEVAGQQVRGPQKRVGVAFQKDMLLDWRTVLANVLLQVELRGLKKADYRDHAIELLEGVGLGKFIDKYPRELSGGMRQRVAVCRALLHDPPLLLMDEPFAALDLLTRDQIAWDFQQAWLRQPKTVLFVTHSVSEAVLLADRIVVMTPHPGRIADVFDIDLDRPRDLAVRQSPAFSKYEGDIRRALERHGILRS